MRAGRLTLSAAVAALSLGLVTLAPPAVAEEPTSAPAGRAEASVSIEDGPALVEPRLGFVQLRYSCYGDPTTVDVTVTAGAAEAIGSTAIPCQDGADLPAGVRLTVPDRSPGFPPGTYTVTVRASIPGQATLVTDVVVEGPPGLAQVTLTASASPREVVRGRTVTVSGSVRRANDLVALRTALQFRPDGGRWRTVKHVTSSEGGILGTKVKPRRSGSFRFSYAGDATTAAGVSDAVRVVVLPKPRAYRSCKALNRVYEHGVGRSGATEVGLGVTSWTRSTAAYRKNKRFDRDRDGVACERV